MAGVHGRVSSTPVGSVLVTVTTLMLLAGGCSGAADEISDVTEFEPTDLEPADPEPPEAEQLEPGEGGLLTVDFAIDVTSVMSLIPFVVAEERGFFEQEGVRVGDLLEVEAAATTLRHVRDGDVTMADVATGAAIEAHLAGTPIKVVGSGHQGAYDCTFSAQPDSGIDGVADMVGRRWGVTEPGSPSHELSYVLPRAADEDVDAFQRVFTGGMSGGIVLLEAGEVELALITPLALGREPRAISPRLRASPDPGSYEVAFEALDYLDAYQKNVYITEASFAEQNPEAVRGILTALNRGFQFVRENAQQSAEIFAEQSDLYDRDTLIDEIELANSRGALEGGVGFNVVGLQNVGVGLRLRKGIEAIPWSEILDPSFLPEGVASEIPQEAR